MWLSKVLIDSVPEASPTMEVFLRNLDQQPSYTCPRSHPYAFNKVTCQSCERQPASKWQLLNRVRSAVQLIWEVRASSTSALTPTPAARQEAQASTHPLTCPALCKGWIKRVLNILGGKKWNFAKAESTQLFYSPLPCPSLRQLPSCALRLPR